MVVDTLLLWLCQKWETEIFWKLVHFCGIENRIWHSHSWQEDACPLQKWEWCVAMEYVLKFFMFLEMSKNKGETNFVYMHRCVIHNFSWGFNIIIILKNKIPYVASMKIKCLFPTCIDFNNNKGWLLCNYMLFRNFVGASILIIIKILMRPTYESHLKFK